MTSIAKQDPAQGSSAVHQELPALQVPNPYELGVLLGIDLNIQTPPKVGRVGYLSP